MPDLEPFTERRTNPELRAIFPAACELLRPFFDPDNRWHGVTHDHLALHALKDHFPQLGAQDRYMIMTAARRLFASGNTPPAA
ncbi:MAG: hypothetical protein HYS20_03120 [Rhodocyclales bacterium]|nr:hypothetical protein [Rhodocyclales bacterium]